MEFAFYSISMICCFAATRWITENIKFHVRNNLFWLHHWIIASIAMGVLLALQIDHPWLWGGLSGVALEGLARKNWSIMRNSRK